MQFAAADIAAMLAAFGDIAIIGGLSLVDGVLQFDDVADLDALGTVGTSYPCVFDAPGKVANMFTGQLETTQPMITMSAADATAAGIRHGTPLTVGGSVYYVTAIDPDGYGFIGLQLSSEAP